MKQTRDPCAVARRVLLLALLLGLAACGNKGPLVHPQPVPAPAASSAA